MTGAWLTVALVAAMAVTAKAAGPVLLGGRELPERLRRSIAVLAPVLLAALIATQIFGAGRSLTVDARAVGLAVGAAALALRLPALAAVVAAAVATGLTRALT